MYRSGPAQPRAAKATPGAQFRHYQTRRLRVSQSLALPFAGTCQSFTLAVGGFQDRIGDALLHVHQVADAALQPLQPVLAPAVAFLQPVLMPLSLILPYAAALALAAWVIHKALRVRAKYVAAQRLSQRKRQDLNRVKARFMAALHDDAGSQEWITAHSPRSVEQLNHTPPRADASRRTDLPSATAPYSTPFPEATAWGACGCVAYLSFRDALPSETWEQTAPSTAATVSAALRATSGHPAVDAAPLAAPTSAPWTSHTSAAPSHAAVLPSHAVLRGGEAREGGPGEWDGDDEAGEAPAPAHEVYAWNDDEDDEDTRAAEREWRAFTRKSKMDIVRDKWDISLLNVAEPY